MIRKKCIANNTLVKFMPDAFSRHKLNKTCFKDDAIRWSIEMIFSDRSTKILAHDIPETWTIMDLIAKYKSESVQYSEYRFVSMYFKSNPQVSYFVQADVGESNTFHLLDPESSIMESLKFKTVIEYPTIYVTTKPSSFRSIECKDFDVRAKMIELGLLNDGKRKRNNRRRSYKRQKKGKIQNSSEVCKDNNDKADVDGCEKSIHCEKPSDAKSNLFVQHI